MPAFTVSAPLDSAMTLKNFNIPASKAFQLGIECIKKGGLEAMSMQSDKALLDQIEWKNGEIQRLNERLIHERELSEQKSETLKRLRQEVFDLKNKYEPVVEEKKEEPF